MAGITITIQNQVIEFPISGTSPNWAPALIKFAQAVQNALSSIAGDYDVAPQTLAINNFNPGSNIDIEGLTFPPSEVQSATVIYSVFRGTDESSLGAGDNQFLVESAQIDFVYNQDTGEWTFTRIGQGDAKIEFDIDNSTGRVSFSTEAISGINHTGIISFRAITILNN